MFPAIGTFATGHLPVTDGNKIYWEASGNPQGKPALHLRGGPGSGIMSRYRRHFDPEKVRERTAMAWCAWEEIHVSLDPKHTPSPRFRDPEFRLLSSAQDGSSFQNARKKLGSICGHNFRQSNWWSAILAH
jgi:hypothetical protein